ncbi:hypothetical protein H072_8324 [Dactylellina haptotyla CBS 200.50]|uniref:NAD(P)-binding domain-containing protein n=1 Tax=Dactylellina haptotyla (strain CBS 200.50) TaxID=1284197 RepID=S8A597_DACHA|nr:hypothetical protein H072_8324 [Dactylellina haptotyla CBS 200.50]
MSHIILTGATGLAGSAILHYCLSSSLIAKISILSRRPVDQGTGNPKVNVIIHKDFESYPPELLAELSDATACIWAQGISAIGMKESDYTKITVDYPLAAAQAFAGLNGGSSFRFIYVSGDRADPSGGYPQMWSRIKGRAETLLLDMNKSTPSFAVYNVRPAIMDPGNNWTAQRTKSVKDKTIGVAAALLRPIAPSQVTPLDKFSQVLVSLAVGDGRPVPEGKGVIEGRTLLNTALRRMAGI